MMSNLTKEKCIEAVIYLANGENYMCTFGEDDYHDCKEICGHENYNCGYFKNYNLLNNLINEHFDNPPLELEELKVGMHCYVFVNTEVPTFNMKVDALITKICDDKRIEFIFVVENGMVVYKRIPFKENRFYAKEVKDDE